MNTEGPILEESIIFFNEGREAFDCNNPFVDNRNLLPYKKGSRESIQWLSGYCTAEMQYYKEYYKVYNFKKDLKVLCKNYGVYLSVCNDNIRMNFDKYREYLL